MKIPRIGHPGSTDKLIMHEGFGGGLYLSIRLRLWNKGCRLRLYLQRGKLPALTAWTYDHRGVQRPCGHWIRPDQDYCVCELVEAVV